MGDSGNVFSGKKGQPKYICIKCDFECSKKYDWDRHMLTSKHKKEIVEMDYGQKGQTNRCELCNKIFKTCSGLWKHKKKCNENIKHVLKEDIKEDTKEEIYDVTQCVKEEIKDIKQDIDDVKELVQIKEEFHLDKELILMIIHQNKELIHQNKELLEIVKNGTHNTTHTNSHNKAFNLNFFLNETCKNAMNINDFVDSIKLQLSDLMNVGELGFVEGISNIIVKNLNNLDETERPVHCTDKKRETIYIKDEGKWEKADDNKTQLRNMIKRIANKNINLLPKFREKYPEYKNSYSKVSDVYDKMVIEVMETDPVKSEKIIRNISKVITISQNK